MAGFWSMIHDCSCPAGYASLWSRMRSLLGAYMPPVEEACAGLFPPMVQKILIINVPVCHVFRSLPEGCLSPAAGCAIVLVSCQRYLYPIGDSSYPGYFMLGSIHI